MKINSYSRGEDWYTRVLCQLRIWASLIMREERCRAILLNDRKKRKRDLVRMSGCSSKTISTFKISSKCCVDEEKLLWQYYKLLSDRCVFLEPQRLNKLRSLVTILRTEILKWRRLPVVDNE